MESLNDVLHFSAFDAESVAQRILPAGTAKDFGSLLIPLEIVATDFYTQSVGGFRKAAPDQRQGPFERRCGR